MMFEQALVGGGTALIVSLCAHALLLWEVRRDLRHLALDLAELQTDLLSEKRKRAASASLESRSRRGLTPDDEAAVERALLKPPVEDDTPWWAGLTGKREQ